MKKIILPFICLMLVAALSACHTVKKSAVGEDVAALNGTWLLTYITGPRITFDGLFPKRKPTLHMDVATWRVNGFSGCNNYMGPVTVKGDSLKFGNLASTMMACAEGSQGEAVYTKTLAQITNYQIRQDTLVLLMKDVEAMYFVREKQ